MSSASARGQDAISSCVNSSDDIVIIPDCKASTPQGRGKARIPGMSQSVIRMTYRIETAGDVAALAAKIASDQSTGTFVPTPGETPELKARVGARVVDVATRSNRFRRRPFPRRTRRRRGLYSRGEADIEFPLDAVGTDLAALTTIAIGGVFSIKGFSGIRIVDMKLPPEFAAAHPGPQFGIEGSRALTGVRGPADHRHDRQAGARPAPARDRGDGARAGRGRRRLHQGRREADEPGLFEPRGSGEGDHADHSRSRAEDRQEGDVRLRDFARRSRGDAAQSRHRRRRRRQRRGHQHQFDRLRRLCVPAQALAPRPARASQRLGHPHAPSRPRAGFPRLPAVLAAARASTSFRSTASAPNIGSRTIPSCARSQALREPLFSPSDRPLPVAGSGQWGGQAPETFARTGRTQDLLYLCGGGVVSHPGGPAAGRPSRRQAWEAAVAGIPLEIYARDHRELAQSIAKFGGAKNDA